MVERRKLTPQFIDQLGPPERGERWISDAELAGFGVRLWGGRTKGKSFAVRVNVNGKIIRKTIFEASGTSLNIARKIASNHIADLKNTPPENPLATKIKAMSFGELAAHAIASQRKTTRSTQYVDDNEMRYIRYTPQSLLSKRALDVIAKDLRDALIAVGDKSAQRRNLRSFYSYVFNLAYKLSGEKDFWRIVYRLNGEKIQVHRTKAYSFESHMNLKEADFDKLFEVLSQEKKHLQQANFIALLFSTGIPVCLSRLFRATWDEFYVERREKTKSKPEREYLIWEPKRHTERSKFYSRTRLKGDAWTLLLRIKEYNYREFPGSPFLFPSKLAPKTGHISTCDFYWRQIKHQTDLTGIPLVELVRTYSRLTMFKGTDFDP